MQVDELVYGYNPDMGFDYNEFLDKVLDIMADYLEKEYMDGHTIREYPRCEDCPEEFRTMFERMGVKRLNGRNNFYFSKPMTYIHAVTPIHEENGVKYESNIRNVCGILTIAPKNLQIIT